jgi:sulfite exporter TauE/SafE/copper chaperone CopZ
MGRLELKIDGMTCSSCEVLIERKFRKIPGVDKVSVSQAMGRAEILCSKEPSLETLQDALKGHKYSVSRLEGGPSGSPEKDPSRMRPEKKPSDAIEIKRDHFEAGAALLILAGSYLLLRQLNLLPEGLGVSDDMSLVFVFILGLVASVSSCAAVTGGLLLAVTAKYNEMNPGLSSWQKFKPHCWFNAGRIAGYTILGAALGLLGKALAPSLFVSGILTVLASLVMLVFGLQLLKVFPWLNRFQFRMPKWLAHRIHDASGRPGRATPFLLGGATFFLPCGFTQALQIYVLGKGDPVLGGLVMLAFSLGTLPGLVGIGALASFTQGIVQRYFFKFAGALVLLLGLFNITNGLALAGVDTGAFANPQPDAQDAGANIVDGKQIVEMKIDGLSYSPSQFTVIQGVPVEWRIDGTNAVGCAQVINVPKLDMTVYAPRGVKTVIFTPEETGTLRFGCSMGMTTPGAAFNVVPNTAGIVPAKTDAVAGGCDASGPGCEAQRISMEVSNAGFSPRTWTVRKGVPVELEINAQVQPGGCMSTFVIPEYDVAHLMKEGKSVLRFTPDRTGVVPWTCAMGARMGQFNVVE